VPCDLHQGLAWAWAIPVATAGLVAGALVAYVRGWRRLQRASPRRAAGLRPWAFASGMLVALVVIGSPFSALDHELLAAESPGYDWPELDERDAPRTKETTTSSQALWSPAHANQASPRVESRPIAFMASNIVRRS